MYRAAGALALHAQWWWALLQLWERPHFGGLLLFCVSERESCFVLFFYLYLIWQSHTTHATSTDTLTHGQISSWKSTTEAGFLLFGDFAGAVGLCREGTGYCYSYSCGNMAVLYWQRGWHPVRERRSGHHQWRDNNSRFRFDYKRWKCYTWLLHHRGLRVWGERHHGGGQQRTGFLVKSCPQLCPKDGGAEYLLSCGRWFVPPPSLSVCVCVLVNNNFFNYILCAPLLSQLRCHGMMMTTNRHA